MSNHAFLVVDEKGRELLRTGDPMLANKLMNMLKDAVAVLREDGEKMATPVVLDAPSPGAWLMRIGRSLR